MFGKRVHLCSGHHKMVEYAHIDQGQRPHQGMRQAEVGFAGCAFAGRVVMGQHDPGGIPAQRRLDDFARIHAGMGIGVPTPILYNGQHE